MMNWLRKSNNWKLSREFKRRVVSFNGILLMRRFYLAASIATLFVSSGFGATTGLTWDASESEAHNETKAEVWEGTTLRGVPESSDDDDTKIGAGYAIAHEPCGYSGWNFGDDFADVDTCTISARTTASGDLYAKSNYLIKFDMLSKSGGDWYTKAVAKASSKAELDAEVDGDVGKTYRVKYTVNFNQSKPDEMSGQDTSFDLILKATGPGGASFDCLWDWVEQEWVLGYNYLDANENLQYGTDTFRDDINQTYTFYSHSHSKCDIVTVTASIDGSLTNPPVAQDYEVSDLGSTWNISNSGSVQVTIVEATEE